MFGLGGAVGLQIQGGFVYNSLDPTVPFGLEEGKYAYVVMLLKCSRHQVDDTMTVTLMREEADLLDKPGKRLPNPGFRSSVGRRRTSFP